MKTVIGKTLPLVALTAVAALLGATGCGPSSEGVEMINVSYDPTRELYEDYNAAFAQHWSETTGETPSIKMSHGGSGKQARAVLDGLDASVVTLALAYDVDALRQADLIPADWQSRLPYNSCPYTSTIVFLVRAGNPKEINDWGDLVKPGVKVITPNPKTSGGARWNYLAAWGYALKRELGSLDKLKDPQQADAIAQAEQKAQEFVTELFHHVDVLDTGARGSTMTFVKRNMGDVLLAWENEAILVVKDLGPDKFEIKVPSISILAEPPVCLVDKVADKKGTRQLARAYLEYLYSKEGQTIAAKHYYRPRSPELVPKEYLENFDGKLELFTVDEVFGGWEKAQQKHFDDKGVFSRIYQP